MWGQLYSMWGELYSIKEQSDSDPAQMANPSPGALSAVFFHATCNTDCTYSAGASTACRIDTAGLHDSSTDCTKRECMYSINRLVQCQSSLDMEIANSAAPIKIIKAESCSVLPKYFSRTDQHKHDPSREKSSTKVIANTVSVGVYC